MLVLRRGGVLWLGWMEVSLRRNSDPSSIASSAALSIALASGADVEGCIAGITKLEPMDALPMRRTITILRPKPSLVLR